MEKLEKQLAERLSEVDVELVLDASSSGRHLTTPSCIFAPQGRARQTRLLWRESMMTTLRHSSLVGTDLQWRTEEPVAIEQLQLE
jgi:hypothetical protein